jgi:hypothetical protein
MEEKVTPREEEVEELMAGEGKRSDRSWLMSSSNGITKIQQTRPDERREESWQQSTKRA